MKHADMQESWPPSREYITHLRLHHFSAHMWPVCVCVLLHYDPTAGRAAEQ